MERNSTILRGEMRYLLIVLCLMLVGCVPTSRSSFKYDGRIYSLSIKGFEDAQIEKIYYMDEDKDSDCFDNFIMIKVRFPSKSHLYFPKSN